MTMVSSKVTALAAVVGLLSYASPADAFWRMPCRARTGLARMDPIVHPNSIADHAHVIHGGSGFSMGITPSELKNSKCTSCGVTQDKSAYWTPSLHFMYTNGTTVLVPQIGGMLAYYMLNKDSYDGTGTITAFPEGFQLLAGDKNLRNYTGPTPDPPLNEWTGDQGTQFALGQKAVGFNCLNYQRAPEPSLYRHTLPDKAYMDANCADGIRAELMFPSCWNGKDIDSPDHRSHVQYPSFVMTGICPAGYKTKLPSLFYETIWDVNYFKGVDGQFMWSQGDPTGAGYHGDFMMGWDSVDFLQQAVNKCTNLSGLIQDCAAFDIQSDYSAGDCSFTPPSVLAKDNVAGPRQGLPGNVPVQLGPGYATRYSIQGQDAATTIVSSSAPPAASVPVVPYTPKPSTSSLPYVDPVPSYASSSAAAITTVKAVAVSTIEADMPTSATSTAPVTTAPPAADSTSSQSLETIGTSYITKPYEVVQIVIVQTYVTVTAAAPTANKARRHLDSHLKHAYQRDIR